MTTTATGGTTTPPVACTVTVIETPAAGDLVAIDAAVSQTNQSLPGYAQVSKDQVVVSGRPAYRRSITFALADGTPVRGEQVYFVAGPVTGGILCATVPAAFAGLAPTFDGVAGSLKLISRPKPNAPRA